MCTGSKTCAPDHRRIYACEVPSAVEFAQTEVRISGMTEAELVEMADHAADYEPWAFDLGRAELAHRRLQPAEVAELRRSNATAAVRPRLEDPIVEHFALHLLASLGLVAFPFYFVLRLVRASRTMP
jgi:hypothetical protein